MVVIIAVAMRRQTFLKRAKMVSLSLSLSLSVSLSLSHSLSLSLSVRCLGVWDGVCAQIVFLGFSGFSKSAHIVLLR